MIGFPGHGCLCGAAAASGMLLAVTDTVISPGDVERLPVDKARGNFAPGIFVDFLYGGPGNIHLHSALLMGFRFQIDQPDDLKFIQGQQDGFSLCATVRTETLHLGGAAYSSTSRWSGHEYASLFSVYTDYIADVRKTQGEILPEERIGPETDRGTVPCFFAQKMPGGFIFYNTIRNF